MRREGPPVRLRPGVAERLADSRGQHRARTYGVVSWTSDRSFAVATKKVQERMTAAKRAVSASAEPTYTISDLAHEFALTTRAIRFYEDQAMIAPERRGRARVYRERERVRLKLILRGKRLGFSLVEI